tara:strand:+ start:962 stop:1243 length:282 start_codon:yes stop_codon:yes gene_type:complete
MPRYHNINGQSVQFTAQEETDRDAEEAAWAAGANTRAAAEVRKERDAKLAACDWRASSDVALSTAWRTYRAALRDVPAQTGFPENITWPTEPS